MLLFTKINMLYATMVCIFFGVTIGAFVFVSRADHMCPTYMNNGTVGLCYMAVGASAAGIAGVLWPFLPSPMRVYVSLMATMTSGKVFNIQMAIVLYMETIRALRHIQKLTMVPLDVAECLKEETSYSMQLVRRSMFKESHVADMNQGIIEIAASFDKVKRAQDRFRDAIERGFRWLESKGYSCRKTLEQPYERCLDDIEERRWLCEDDIGYKNMTAQYGTAIAANLKCLGWKIERPLMNSICSALRTLGKAACGYFSEERITEALLAVRDRIAAWISNAVRMRVGILFEMHSTNYVEDELANAWAPFKKAMATGSNLLLDLYEFIRIYVIKYMGVVVLVIWPFGYIFCYTYGPLEFDNKYIPEEEQEREIKNTNADTPDELRYLPLQPGAESEKLQMVPAWIPSPNEIAKLVRSLVFMADFLVIVAILVIDFYYTKLVDGIYFGSINFFNRYQGNIFDVVREPDVRGMRYIGQLIVEQLDRLQQAAGLGRMVACARRAPPIDYTYEIFVIALFMRLYYLLSQIKFAWIPSMICARYNKNRHLQRMRCLKAKTLMSREGYEPPVSFPWLRAFYSNFCGFCSVNFMPGWLATLIEAKETFNL